MLRIHVATNDHANSFMSLSLVSIYRIKTLEQVRKDTIEYLEGLIKTNLDAIASAKVEKRVS